jgi:hypothetical protein
MATKTKKQRKKQPTKKSTKKTKTRKKSKSKSNFRSLQCRPGARKLRTSRNTHTCFSSAELTRLRDIWNARHPDDRIDTTCSKQIWLQLKERFSKVCDKESCWIRGMAKSNDIQGLMKAFRPRRPSSWTKKPNEWLSSADISNVMKQYEQTYPAFDFMGPSPIDYDTHEYEGKCVWPELCKFNIQDLARTKGKTMVGVVFNLDPHTKGGSHWVSLFINVPKKRIFFFDSVGTTAPPEIRRFANTVIEQGRKASPPIEFTFDENAPFEHQQSNTECGMYSLFFIANVLEGTMSEPDFKRRVVTDAKMKQFRSIYFNEDL